MRYGNAPIIARGDKLLASNHEKKTPHRTTSENGESTASYPMADFAHFSTKNHAIKIGSYRNACHYPARDTVERRGEVVGVHLVGGGLLHNERAMVIFFGGGYNNHPFTDYYTFDDGDG